MSETLYNVKFYFSKELPEFVKTMVGNEFVKVRNYGCEALNSHYEEWNAQFNAETHEVYENDEFADYGGKAYLEFINNKQRAVLTQVNKKYPSKLVELDVNEYGDMIARCKFDRDITVSIGLIPVINIEPY